MSFGHASVIAQEAIAMSDLRLTAGTVFSAQLGLVVYTVLAIYRTCADLVCNRLLVVEALDWGRWRQAVV
jgi:hypothetical protein